MSTVVYEHLDKYYKELDSLAHDEDQEEGHTLRLFRGSVVRVYRSLGIPQSYYSKVRNGLITMGCITILQQGARGTESVVVLHHEPDADEYKLFVRNARLTPRLDGAILAERVDDLTRLLGGVNVPEALASQQQEINELKKEVRRSGKNPPQARRRVS